MKYIIQTSKQVTTIQYGGGGGEGGYIVWLSLA